MLIIGPLHSPIFQNNIGVHSGPNFRAAQGKLHYTFTRTIHLISVVYWAKITLKTPCSLILSSCLAGAKDAHKVSPHFAQIWYFGLVSAVAMAPVNFSPGHVFHFTRQFQRPKPWFFTFVGCITAYFCIRYFRS